MSGVQNKIVTEDEADQRLDRYLRKHFPHLTQGKIEKLCRKGEVRVDGGRVKTATRLEEGQKVRIPPLGAAADMPAPKLARKFKPSDALMIQNCVLWKDEHMIVLNKPSGLASQGGSGQGDRHVDGLAEALMFGYKDAPKLVHRLDKDTSGLLLLARTDRVARGLSEALRHRNVRKIYWAAVAGTPHPRAGSIKFGLVKGSRGRGGEGEKMHCVHPRDVAETEGAKRAHTDYGVLSTLGGRMSWLAMVPITGRTHQLRAHAAAMGHPIIGDGKYGGSSQENMGDGWGAGIGGDGITNRLHLHARTLIIEHPIKKEEMTFTAPLPPHMQKTWDYVGWDVKHAPLDPFNMPDA